MKQIAFVLLVLGGFLLAGCRKQTSPQAKAADACDLLTSAEVAAIQGCPITATKGSTSSSEGMSTSDCVYIAAESDKSVAVSVSRTKPGATGPKTAAAYWEKVFSPFEKGDEKEERDSRDLTETHGEKEKSGEKEAPAPTRIDGLGDEAFWSPNAMGGSVYALKKSRDAFIRVNIGGPEGREKKLTKSKILAEKALKRL